MDTLANQPVLIGLGSLLSLVIFGLWLVNRIYQTPPNPPCPNCQSAGKDIIRLNCTGRGVFGCWSCIHEWQEGEGKA